MACPGDTERSVKVGLYGAQQVVAADPYGANAATAKMPWQAWGEGALRTLLFAQAKMIGMPAGCPHLTPRIWKAKIV